MTLTTEQMARTNPKPGEIWVDHRGSAVRIEFEFARPADDEDSSPASVVFSFVKANSTREVRFLEIPEFMGVVRDSTVGYVFRYARQVEKAQGGF